MRRTSGCACGAARLLRGLEWAAAACDQPELVRRQAEQRLYRPEWLEHEGERWAVAGLAADGMPFTGFLYAGLMIDDSGAPKVIEYNVRFGDPETQVLIPRLKTPLATLLYKAATDSLDDAVLEWRDDSAVTVVLAAPGYPDAPQVNGVITNIPKIADTKIFHAGTLQSGENLLSTGGRVMTVTGIGSDLTQARDLAYRAISQIELPGSFYRSDIALNASVAEKGN